MQTTSLNGMTNLERAPDVNFAKAREANKSQSEPMNIPSINYLFALPHTSVKYSYLVFGPFMDLMR